MYPWARGRRVSCCACGSASAGLDGEFEVTHEFGQLIGLRGHLHRGAGRLVRVRGHFLRGGVHALHRTVDVGDALALPDGRFGDLRDQLADLADSLVDLRELARHLGVQPHAAIGVLH